MLSGQLRQRRIAGSGVSSAQQQQQQRRLRAAAGSSSGADEGRSHGSLLIQPWQRRLQEVSGRDVVPGQSQLIGVAGDIAVFTGQQPWSSDSGSLLSGQTAATLQSQALRQQAGQRLHSREAGRGVSRGQQQQRRRLRAAAGSSSGGYCSGSSRGRWRRSGAAAAAAARPVAAQTLIRVWVASSRRLVFVFRFRVFVS